MKHFVTFAAVSLFALASYAPRSADASPAPTVTVLKAAHLFDGKSGTLSSPGIIMVKDERIVAVGRDAAIHADAKVIELGDATRVPGFIDAHTHITMDHDNDWAKSVYENTLRCVRQSSNHSTRKPTRVRHRYA